ncbi:MAG: ribosomal protein [Conexibacter sp.]|nr:ribosomal protein [Conexibacter sp.]
MNRDEKAAVIDRIAGELEESQAVFAVDYRGITVSQIADLRTKLRAVDASFSVVKNSLTERAADKAGTVALKTTLEGPTALTFVRGDAAAAAKALSDAQRATQVLAFKGGLLDGQPVTAEEITAIARLPSRQVLYGQLVGVIASPISGLVRTLNALIAGVAIQLQAIHDQNLVGAGSAGAGVAAPEASAVEAPAAEAAPDAPTDSPSTDEQTDAESSAPAELSTESAPADSAASDAKED